MLQPRILHWQLIAALRQRNPNEAQVVSGPFSLLCSVQPPLQIGIDKTGTAMVHVPSHDDPTFLISYGEIILAMKQVSVKTQTNVIYMFTAEITHVR